MHLLQHTQICISLCPIRQNDEKLTRAQNARQLIQITIIVNIDAPNWIIQNAFTFSCHGWYVTTLHMLVQKRSAKHDCLFSLRISVPHTGSFFTFHRLYLISFGIPWEWFFHSRPFAPAFNPPASKYMVLVCASRGIAGYPKSNRLNQDIKCMKIQIGKSKPVTPPLIQEKNLLTLIWISVTGNLVPWTRRPYPPHSNTIHRQIGRGASLQTQARIYSPTPRQQSYGEAPRHITWLNCTSKV